MADSTDEPVSLPHKKTIAEWEREMSEAFETQGFQLNGEESIQEYLKISDEQFSAMDGYGVQDSEILDRFVALYRVNKRRFKSFLPGVFGAYILIYGTLTPDELAGILGVAIDRIADLDPVSGDDPLERMLKLDDDDHE